MAEREGFEPSIGVNPREKIYSFKSKTYDSALQTAQTPLGYNLLHKRFERLRIWNDLKKYFKGRNGKRVGVQKKYGGCQLELPRKKEH